MHQPQGDARSMSWLTGLHSQKGERWWRQPVVTQAPCRKLRVESFLRAGLGRVVRPVISFHSLGDHHELCKTRLKSWLLFLPMEFIKNRFPLSRVIKHPNSACCSNRVTKSDRVGMRTMGQHFEGGHGPMVGWTITWRVFLATKAYCWLIFSLKSTIPPRLGYWTGWGGGRVEKEVHNNPMSLKAHKRVNMAMGTSLQSLPSLTWIYYTQCLIILYYTPENAFIPSRAP